MRTAGVAGQGRLGPRQVFEAYDRSASGEDEDPFFCSRCGSRCVPGQDRPKPICLSCGRVQGRTPAVAVCVMIVGNGKVLLGKRSRQPFEGKWVLPGGGVEFGEDFLTAARREAKEETGLDIEITSIVNVVTNYLTPDLHTLTVACAAKPMSSNDAPGDDLCELRWVGLEGPFPPMAFEADEHAIRWFAETGHTGIAADPVFASG